MFGGGGGTITPEEISELQAYGVERIYHPNDGMQMGLVAMIEDVVHAHRRAPPSPHGRPAEVTQSDDEIAIGQDAVRASKRACSTKPNWRRLRKEWQLAGGKTPVIGLTGTGGAGKSSRSPTNC